LFLIYIATYQYKSRGNSA